LYDTFHEPFKRVVSSRPVSETPVQDNAEPRSVSVEKEEDNATENANKGKNKEPELTVKSALSAAFARYADKVGKRTHSR
jgi:DNA excision repair protein ERCC-1